MSPERFVKGESERTCFQWVRAFLNSNPKTSPLGTHTCLPSQRQLRGFQSEGLPTFNREGRALQFLLSLPTMAENQIALDEVLRSEHFVRLSARNKRHSVPPELKR